MRRLGLVPALLYNRCPPSRVTDAEQETEMTSMTKKMVAIAGLVGVAVTGAPAIAAAGSATLYELTENMKVIQRNGKHRTQVGRRVATSAITGFATPGTPLCPADPKQQNQPPCAVNVMGADNVSLATGLGTLSGTFATVVQGDNPVDGPEAVILRGEFRGDMDFSPAIVHEIPFGTVEGKVKANGSRRGTSFTGVFRLPFAGNIETEVEVAPGVKVKLTLRQLFCPATPDPNPYAEMYDGFDLAYLDNVAEATTPTGRCLNIMPNELSLGAPLVRFDIDF
jgi:hypothetical protein